MCDSLFSNPWLQRKSLYHSTISQNIWRLCALAPRASFLSGVKQSCRQTVATHTEEKYQFMKSKIKKLSS